MTFKIVLCISCLVIGQTIPLQAVYSSLAFSGALAQGDSGIPTLVVLLQNASNDELRSQKSDSVKIKNAITKTGAVTLDNFREKFGYAGLPESVTRAIASVTDPKTQLIRGVNEIFRSAAGKTIIDNLGDQKGALPEAVDRAISNESYPR